MASRRVAVIGGGLMGAGIAQVFAASGFNVCVYEPLEQVRATVVSRVRENLASIGRDESCVERIRTSGDLADTVHTVSFVTEAIPEKLTLKQAMFRELVALAPREAILASNTSVIPITRIAHGLDAADRIVGTHWWNPPYLIPLVEVVQAESTSGATIDATMQLLFALGKKPAHVRKDRPGFIANRMQHALWREAIAMVAEGICDAETLDDCVKNSFGLRLAVLGPLENADLVGLDLTLDIHKTMIPELDRHSVPHQYLEEKVQKGALGFKTGEGFRCWTDSQIKALRQNLSRHLLSGQQKKDGP